MTGPARRSAPPPGSRSRPGAVPLRMILAGVLLTGACSRSNPPPDGPEPAVPPTSAPASMPPGPACVPLENGHGCLKLAPAGSRVDLTRPSFSHPTAITNPTHPSGRLEQVIYGGQVDGEPFRTEFTRLPDPHPIVWDGQRIETVAWQYLGFSAGRIQEVAIDWFAQADDGAVWYFGEDVSEYADGVVRTNEGTWAAGRNGPPGMIMPGNPRVGDVYRPENVPGLVFEEVTVKAVGQTVPGPDGPINGALTVTELHADAGREEKVFAPGFGEFSTGSPEGDLEAATLAVPTDARPGPLPAELAALWAAIRAGFDAVGREDWAGAATRTGRLRAAWDAARAGVPDLLGKQLSRDLEALTAAVAGRRSAAARGAALRLAQDGLDLQLRSRPVAEVDLARLDLWARQVLTDAAAGDAGSVAGNTAALERTRDRVRHHLAPATAQRLDTQLRDLRGSADRKDLAAAARTARALLATLAAG